MIRLRPRLSRASNTRREALWAWLFILPVTLGFFLFVLGPMLASLALSFTKWDLLSPAQWGRRAQLAGHLQRRRGAHAPGPR